MKLRALELTNVRRFAGQRARLDPIGDGLTVLCEPNEFGKSTFFDALHALFFERHRSQAAAAKALRPHSGGAPEVAVDIDLPDGRFRLAKRWLSRPQARVTDATGRLIAAEDEAEAWIDRLLGGGLAGPSGLLWVRQGQLALDPEGSSTEDRRERDRNLATRRDLLSSVAGEIELMTGGRRMDAVAAHVAAELGQLATSTLKPKAGGEWHRATAEVETLKAQEDALRPRAVSLSGDLARRAEVLRDLSRLSDPAEAAARALALQQAHAAQAAAADHHARIDGAATALRLATLGAEAARAEVARLKGLHERAAKARIARDQSAAQAAEAGSRAEALAQRDRNAALTVATADAQVIDLRTRYQAATRQAAAQAGLAQAQDLRKRLAAAQELQASQDQSRARRTQIVVTPKALDAAERAQTAMEQAQALARAQAVTVQALPDPGNAPATLDGTPLPAAPFALQGPVELALPGFGRLRVHPGHAAIAADGANLAQMTATRDKALAVCDAPTLAAARALLAEAQQLDATIRQSVEALAAIAPDGPDSLRRALAAAQAAAEGVQAGAAQMLEAPETLALALAAAEQAAATAHAAADAVHRQTVEAGEARARAEGEYTTAARQLTEAEAEAGDPIVLDAALAGACDTADAAEANRAQAAETLAQLQATAPDLANAQARLALARSRQEQAEKETNSLNTERAALDARIEVLAEEGIEERLANIRGRLDEATARAVRWEAEVRALARLRRALEESRAAAREAYFGPVLRELAPLLALLHPGAALTIDDATLLPTALVRDGQREAVDILSGGTREQLAVLTRLAFARLFAAAGRPVPVILDDALVHSDDDRIEAMFIALHRIAHDQQVLVFTCRQRAFAALGGTRARVQVSAA